MAIAHLSAKIFSRKKGHKIVAAAAYRAGEKLHDERYGETHDYARRQRGIFETYIELPAGSPLWLNERPLLWNTVEAGEHRKDSQLGREVEIGLPHELTDEARSQLVREFVQGEFVSKGMVADVAIHRPSKDGDHRNHHAHILLTMRRTNEHGFSAEKAREWNDKGMLEQWRENWERHCNRALERAGVEARIDMESYAKQGLEQEPTIHEGKAATQMKRRGMPDVERVIANDELKKRNVLREEVERWSLRLQAEIAATPYKREKAALLLQQREDDDRLKEAHAALREKAKEQKLKEMRPIWRDYREEKKKLRETDKERRTAGMLAIREKYAGSAPLSWLELDKATKGRNRKFIKRAEALEHNTQNGRVGQGGFLQRLFKNVRTKTARLGAHMGIGSFNAAAMMDEVAEKRRTWKMVAEVERQAAFTMAKAKADAIWKLDPYRERRNEEWAQRRQIKKDERIALKEHHYPGIAKRGEKTDAEREIEKMQEQSRNQDARQQSPAERQDSKRRGLSAKFAPPATEKERQARKEAMRYAEERDQQLKRSRGMERQM